MDTFKHTASDGKAVHCYSWTTDSKPRALIHIAHGMGEHGARYDWTAKQLNEAGYEVTANDHRGHGQTAESLGDFGADGWHRAIADLNEILLQAKRDQPHTPLILFGHSMGAMMSQQFISRHGETIDALILSGSPGAGSRFQMWLLQTITQFERWRIGDKAESSLLQKLLFGGNNKDFDAEGCTGYEWLSRVPDQVTKYVEDPLCGFVPCPMSLCDLFSAERANWKAESIARIPTSLPTYLFSGSADPIHNRMININRMLAAYSLHGLQVTTRFYTGGRHEMLNETNRDEVIKDLVSWLNSVELG
ncbi:MAG: hypothetical protein CMQ20_02205 [Gammaproteobacteria bacterium]|jgi:alpha-beta hydrolase superfamily lysophospholipase|nr:hypothetical protein [Gammaproteobacteria bacterium]|tara:strand:+ start:427 stop:1341 length:915 start_codon:yes stop_codon:yes gene_type:complete